MSKWKVRLENTIFFHPDEDDVRYGPRWCITSPTGVSWGNKATFAEAIAYADQQARTREVVLPRVGDTTRLVAHNGTPDRHPTGYHIVTKGPECYYTVRILGPWGNMGIYEAQDIRPLALALLAHAERNSNDQHRQSR